MSKSSVLAAVLATLGSTYAGFSSSSASNIAVYWGIIIAFAHVATHLLLIGSL